MLSLRAKTEQMIDKMNGLMEKVSSKLTLRDLKDMSADDIEMLQESVKLYEMSCEIAMKQAEIIESLDKKTDELLEINKTLLARTRDL